MDMASLRRRHIEIIQIMANKREFKKFVESLGASVCDEIMIAYYNVENADKDALAKAIQKVIVAVESARVNSNVHFDRGVKAFADKAEYSKAKKEFYKALFKKVSKEFASELEGALKEFNAALPAEEKERNKAAAAEA